MPAKRKRQHGEFPAQNGLIFILLVVKFQRRSRPAVLQSSCAVDDAADDAVDDAVEARCGQCALTRPRVVVCRTGCLRSVLCVARGRCMAPSAVWHFEGAREQLALKRDVTCKASLFGGGRRFLGVTLASNVRRHQSRSQ